MNFEQLVLESLNDGFEVIRDFNDEDRQQLKKLENMSKEFAQRQLREGWVMKHNNNVYYIYKDRRNEPKIIQYLVYKRGYTLMPGFEYNTMIESKTGNVITSAIKRWETKKEMEKEGLNPEQITTALKI